jgi:hypothetical protein
VTITPRTGICFSRFEVRCERADDLPGLDDHHEVEHRFADERRFHVQCIEKPSGWLHFLRRCRRKIEFDELVLLGAGQNAALRMKANGLLTLHNAFGPQSMSGSQGRVAAEIDFNGRREEAESETVIAEAE